jgi:anti-sigma regulatory factor (Ser/Thr protein kinase)
MIGDSELRLHSRADPALVRPLRHALIAFLRVFDIDSGRLDDILTAVGETLANVVEHAYASDYASDLELVVRVRAPDTVEVDVYDRGRFVERGERPGRGFGLRIVRAIARDVTIETDGGTHVRMLFDAPLSAGDRRSA